MAGPEILFIIPLLGGIPVTETLRNAWLAMAIIIVFAFWLTRGLTTGKPTKRQAFAETAVNMLYDLVKQTMGADKLFFAPYIGTIFCFSIVCSLMSMFSLRPPTADLNTILAWGLIFFTLVQFFGLQRKGLGGWLKKFAEPMAVITPLNIISELSTPISMVFRHFGNIAAGVVITSLLYTGLAAISNLFLGWLTDIPLLQFGLPAVLSVYFDLFTSFMQAYIFSMLNMVFISSAMD